MNGARVIRQQTASYTIHGQTGATDEVFMQFFVSFMRDGALGKLKGAPLSAFVAIGLHEAEILIGDAPPFTLHDIMAVTAWSRSVLVDALDFLVAERFIAELPCRGPNREKQYRIAAYMWFGSGQHQRRGPSNTDARRRAPSNAHKSRSPDSGLSGKNTPSSSSYIPGGFSGLETTTCEGGVGGTPGQKILLAIGIFSARDFPVEEDQARAIAEAVKSEAITAAYAYGCLKHDPHWRPAVVDHKPWYGEYTDLVER